jgi:hypothetical protein
MCTLHEDKRETAAFVLVQCLAMELAQYCDPRLISVGMITDRGVAVPVCTTWTAYFEGVQVTSGRKLINAEPQFTLDFELTEGEWLLVKPAVSIRVDRVPAAAPMFRVRSGVAVALVEVSENVRY